MILAGLSDLVTVPFGYLLAWLYQLTTNYGWALILFAILVKVILLPITAKGKKSSMKMARITPRVQALQKKYANDQQKQADAIRQLYKEEGVGMTGGCLWSFVPLLILFPLYTVVREPITYMLHESKEVAESIVATIKAVAPNGTFSANNFYDQMVAAPLIPQFAENLKAAIPNLSTDTLEGVNFLFLGIDLGKVPTVNILGSNFNWANVGAFLLPVLSAGSQVLSMLISQKINNSLITDEKGLQDEETAKKSQANQTSKIMMWTMPLLSLWIGFTIPTALSLYWLIQGVVSIVLDSYLTVKYRKIYDAEDAARLQKAMEEDAIEAEKERLRAQRRAENPDGITENTSKKKLQQKQQKQAEADKAAAAKEYAAKKGIAVEEDTKAPKVLSGVPERPYCKGRAYDPNRYTQTEE